uniref:Uncharacterized protein n=2 Tax=Candidatus Kentrum sp. FM TaxID=2126340 RepID=A0A450WBY4_9GAMM|nr:MAG: hypothetical protein BECKFM1743B_GA0114221_103233 [Candidatus Kentron sp. FM]
MDKKSPFLAQFSARMSAFERENTTFLLVFHPVSADVIFWECTPCSASRADRRIVNYLARPRLRPTRHDPVLVKRP